jgi:hypothetical protein
MNIKSLYLCLRQLRYAKWQLKLNSAVMSQISEIGIFVLVIEIGDRQRQTFVAVVEKEKSIQNFKDTNY